MRINVYFTCSVSLATKYKKQKKGITERFRDLTFNIPNHIIKKVMPLFDSTQLSVNLSTYLSI